MRRRAFVMAGMATTMQAAAAPDSKVIPLDGKLPSRLFGKTGNTLPILGMGGAAFTDRYAQILNVPQQSRAERIALTQAAFESGIRYFDTARGYQDSEECYGEALRGIRDKVYIASKVFIDLDSGPLDPEKVRQSVATSLEKLQTDYLDCIQIHMPRDYDRAMRARDVLDAMRRQGAVRFIGVSNHQNFDVTHRLVSTGAFDQVLLAYGYFNGGLGMVYTNRTKEYRAMTLAKAHELGMGIVAMKVMGATIFGHNAAKMVPDFDARRRALLPGAAIRWVLADERVHVLNIGLSVRGDAAENVRTVRGELKLTPADRELLADFTRRVYESEAAKKMLIV